MTEREGRYGAGTALGLQTAKRWLLVAAFAHLGAWPGLAATVTTVGSGNWSNTAVNAPWPGGTVPVAGSDIIIASGHSVTVSAAVANSPGTVTINSGGQLAVGGFNLTVSGATTVGGTLKHTATGGTRTFTGDVTINLGGTWNEAAAAVLSFGGNLQNDGTFTASTGVHTFTGAGKTFSGTNTISIASVTVNGTYTNNGTLTVGTALAGSGTLTQGASASSILNIGMAAASLTLATLDANGSGNTVNYTGAAQTAKPTAYNNLTLSGSGAKTLTGVTNNGILSMEGTATASVAPTYGAAATLQYNTATARTAGPEWTNAFTASGGVIVTNTGAITINAPKVFSASVPLAVQSGAALAAGTNRLTLGGAFTNGGTFTSTGTVEWNGAGAQSVTVGSYSNLVLSGSGTKFLGTGTAATGNLSIAPTGSAAIASVATGLNVGVGSLTLGSLGRLNGTWGPSTSSATYTNDVFFSPTTGYLSVTADARTTPTVTSWPTATAITTAQALSNSVLSGGAATNVLGVSVAGSFAFTVPATMATAGTYSASVTFSLVEAATYSNAIGNVNVAVFPTTNTYYVVPANLSPASPYNSWASAATNIQTAVDKASADRLPGTNVCVVLVSNGVYTVTTNLFVTNAITIRGVNGWTNTAVNGGGVTRCFWIGNAAAVVDGLTISNGLASGGGNPTNQGGGVYMTGGTLQNCLVTKNRVGGSQYHEGGGILMSGGATVQYCIISSNSAAGGSWNFGGGVSMRGGTVQNCLIQGNIAGNSGGSAVFSQGPNDYVRNCLIIGNYSADGGSGFRYGGAVKGEGTGPLSLYNCTIVGNQGGPALNRSQSAAFDVRNCVVYGNVDTAGSLLNYRSAVTAMGSGQILYSCTTPDPLPHVASNVTDDPKFVNAGSGYGTNYVPGDLHLQYGSLSLDSGTTLASVTNDFEGNPRPLNGRGAYGSGPAYDMGIYESSYTSGAFCCAIKPGTLGGMTPLTNTFTAAIAGSNAVTSVVYYWWTFGTGTTPQEGANKQVVTNVFTPGQYAITLTVSNSLGTVASNTVPVTISVAGTTAYVATNGTSIYPYDTWGHAATNIQDAVTAANVLFDGGYTNPSPLVLVSNGVYTLSTHIFIDRGIVVQAVGGRSNTLVNGAGVTRCFLINHASALVDGFTISNGLVNGSGAPDNRGGGVYLGAGMLQNCRITQNRANSEGGGIFMSGGALVQYCDIVSNSSPGSGWNQGGGVSMYGGTVQNCLIQGNTAGAAGGSAIQSEGWDLVQNCLIIGNSSGDGGSAYRYGGAVKGDGRSYPAGLGQLYLYNCTVVGNQGGAALNYSGDLGMNVRNCIVCSNLDLSGNLLNYNTALTTAYLLYCCTTPDPLPHRASNVTDDPKFVNTGSGYGTNFLAGDYHLQFGSPAIDSGLAIAAITNDFDGMLRPQNGGTTNGIVGDMGCYEASFAGAGLSCSINPSVAGGMVPLTNVFTAIIGGGSAVTNVVYYWWDFGPGTTPQAGSTKRVVTNTFASGLYPITLIVSNNLGTLASNTLAAIQVVGNTAYVATNGAAVYPYDTWSKAATNIQNAIDAVNVAWDAGCTNPLVAVSNGIYAISTELLLSRGVTMRSTGGKDATFLVPRTGFNKRGVYMQDPLAMVDGFTITGFNCINTGSGDDGSANGSGVLIVSSGSGSTLQNCTVSSCTNAGTYSGAIYSAGPCRIRNCLIERNKLGRAAAVYFANAAALMENCTVRYNSNTDWGGAGATLAPGGGTIRNCLFYGNVSTLSSAWGTLFIDAGLLENCTVVGNENGGVYMRSGGTVRNCIVYDNSYANYTNISGMIEFTCTAPFPSVGTHNVSVDPQFVQTGGGYGLSCVGGDYRPRNGLCINSGTNQTWMTNAVDLAGARRINNLIVDLGAYETASPGTVFKMR